MIVLLVGAAAAYAATGLYSVEPNQEAIVRRCGKFVAERGPGLHFGFPWGVDRVDRIKVLEPKRVGVGIGLFDRALGRRVRPQQAEGLTGDRNLILVSAIVEYHIADANAYLFHVADVPMLVENVTASALSSIIASMNVDDVLTVQRTTIRKEVMEAAQEALDNYAAGVTITSVSLEGLNHPEEVAPAFRDVNSARADRETRINEARGYASRIIPRARGQAERILIEAEAYQSEVFHQAQGDAESFRKMVDSLSDDWQLTAKRLILETMEEVLPRLRKIVLDDGAGKDLDLGLIEGK